MNKVQVNSEGLQGNAHAQTVLSSLRSCGTARGHYPSALSGLAEFVLEIEKKDSCASINFVLKNKIQELNKTYRNVDSVTDVLSFESDIENDLGDIFICFDVIEENAKKLNTSIENELNLIIVHGMLHLCGYDHMNDEEAKIMEAREEEILDAWYAK